MRRKKANYLPLILLPIIIFSCIAVWLLNSITLLPVVAVELDGAAFDMREIDFDNTITFTAGNVEYIPGELLTAEEFALRDDIQIGRVQDDVKVVTMRATVLVPDAHYYGVMGYSANYASSVYINGKWLFDEGQPSLTPESESAYEAYRLFSVLPEDGKLEIIIQTSSYSSGYTAGGMEWHIGEYENMRIHYLRYVTTRIVIMAWYLLLAILALLLFFVLPGYRGSVWLALLSVVWAVRTGLTGIKAILSLFPFWDWSVYYKAEILTMPLTVILLTLIINSIFKDALNKWFRRGILAIGAAGCGLVFALPWKRFFGHSYYTNLILHIIIGALLVAVLFSLRRKKPTLPQTITLIGLGMVILSFLWDSDYFGLRVLDLPFSLAQPVMLMFILFMFVTTMLDTMAKTAAAEVELTETVETQKREVMESRTAIMLSQIQPHFLYNALTSINNLCQGNPEARKAITTFSEYLRGNMDSLNDNSLISIETELEHTRQYLWLEELRFEERLSVAYELEAGVFLIPALTIQPIVENAVRYGITKKEAGGTVTIRTERTAQSIRITITDDGVGFDAAKPPVDDGRSHIGITSVRARLSAMCGGSLTVKSAIGEGTTAIIELPLEGVII